MVVAGAKHGGETFGLGTLPVPRLWEPDGGLPFLFERSGPSVIADLPELGNVFLGVVLRLEL